jgi:broad specificity phosphatase PhoE
LNWPARLWIVRHGESAGNVAYMEAEAARAERIALTGRDVDVPLSERGKRQAKALGTWFAGQETALQPDVILASPYERARATADLIRAEMASKLREDPPIIDERLRERELGLLDTFTAHGIRAAHPEQAQRREILGKFYYRPPLGESWCDVILRLRSALDSISLHYAGRRVLIVSHQMVVLCFRYLIENLDESSILAIDREAAVANCSVTEYEARRKGEGTCLALVRYNFTSPLEQAHAPITHAPSKGGLKS